MTPIKRTLTLFALALVASCANQSALIPAGSTCTTTTFAVLDDFSGARRGACEVRGDNSVRIEIVPEDSAVQNPSPWFAFKLVPARATSAEVVLDYQSWKHRYVPKTSADGVHWSPLAADAVQVSANGRRATLSIALGNETVWVAAHELITPTVYDDWEARMAARSNARLSVFGESRTGRKIMRLDGTSDSRDVVLLVGRQHPPEVSGAFAFFGFWETVFGDSSLAARFREHFQVISIPLLNPDGVANGHWRHNLGRTDLNRDWGPFVQPETQLIKTLLDKLDRDGYRLRAFIDFHSTNRNLFYTQADTDPTDPPNFSRDWLDAARPRLNDYPFTNEDRPTSDTANGKNYMYKRYGIPSVTYEVGDEIDRAATRAAAAIFAEEFMKLLLQHADQQ